MNTMFWTWLAAAIILAVVITFYHINFWMANFLIHKKTVKIYKKIANLLYKKRGVSDNFRPCAPLSAAPAQRCGKCKCV